MPDMVVRQFFIDGLFGPLQEKVACKEPGTFKEALRVARQKYQSLMFKLYHEEVRPSREDYHRYQASQTSIPTCVSLNNSTSTKQDDVPSPVPTILSLEDEPLGGDILEETLSVRHQVSDEQEEAVHKFGKDSVPQAPAPHQQQWQPSEPTQIKKKVKAEIKSK